MNLEEFTECADRIINTEIPEALLQRLNLGIIVIPESKREGDGYVMGHYSVDRLGRHVALFYGSFKAILRNRSPQVWETQIRRTIRHELRHHVESLAGDNTLARQEARARRRESRPHRPPGKHTGDSLLDRLLRWLR